MPRNDLGRFLVEDCKRLSIKDFLASSKEKLKKTLLESEIQISGYYVGLDTTEVSGGGTRYWWKCPMCHERKGILFSHPYLDLVGCRKCLQLRYRKSRFKNMIESHVYS